MNWEKTLKVDRKRKPITHSKNPSIVIDGRVYYYEGDSMETLTNEQLEAMKNHIRSTADHQEWLDKHKKSD